MKYNLICTQEYTGVTSTFKHVIHSWWEAREVIKCFMSLLNGHADAIAELYYEEWPEKSTAIIFNKENVTLCTFRLGVIPRNAWNGTYFSGDWTDGSAVLVDTSHPRKKK